MQIAFELRLQLCRLFKFPHCTFSIYRAIIVQSILCFIICQPVISNSSCKKISGGAVVHLFCAPVTEIAKHQAAFKRFITIAPDDSKTVVGFNNIVIAITVAVHHLSSFFGEPVVFIDSVIAIFHTACEKDGCHKY